MQNVLGFIPALIEPDDLVLFNGVTLSGRTGSDRLVEWSIPRDLEHPCESTALPWGTHRCSFVMTVTYS